MSNSTNSTSCAAFLFSSISVESTPQQLGNICPDTIINYLVAGVILTSAITLFISCLSMLIVYWWRNRNKDNQLQTERMAYIKARNPIIMLINMSTSAGIATFHTVRYLIGRKIFPCGLLGLSYFLIPPVIFLPTILRSSRLFSMARINSLITNTRKGKTLSMDRSGKSNMVEFVMGNFPTDEEVVSSPCTTSVLSSGIPTLDSNISSNKQSETKKVEFKIDNSSFNNEQPTESNMSDTESDVGSLFDIDTTISKSVINQLRILNILISNKFIFIVYFSILAGHVLLWLLLGGIEEGIYQSNPSNPRIFTGFLYFTSGCIVNINAVIVIICQGVIYLLVEVVLLIVCFFSDRDTYMIKLETYLIVGLQAAVIVIFGLSYVPAINRYTEYFYAGGNIISTFAVIELLVSNFLPLLLSLYKDHVTSTNRKSATMTPSSQQSDEENPKIRASLYGLSVASTSSIIKLLKHKKYFEQFLLFSKRSYCPENILCWRDIEIYKRLKKDSSRRRVGAFIVKTYLLHHSPLELNISRDEKKVQEIEQILSNKSVQLGSDLFDFLQLHCLLNMLDIFERIKSSNKEIRDYLRSDQNTSTSTNNLLINTNTPTATSTVTTTTNTITTTTGTASYPNDNDVVTLPTTTQQ